MSEPVDKKTQGFYVAIAILVFGLIVLIYYTYPYLSGAAQICTATVCTSAPAPECPAPKECPPAIECPAPTVCPPAIVCPPVPACPLKTVKLSASKDDFVIEMVNDPVSQTKIDDQHLVSGPFVEVNDAIGNTNQWFPFANANPAPQSYTFTLKSLKSDTVGGFGYWTNGDNRDCDHVKVQTLDGTVLLDTDVPLVGGSQPVFLDFSANTANMVIVTLSDTANHPPRGDASLIMRGPLIAAL
jgi:hypothetical protein